MNHKKNIHFQNTHASLIQAMIEQSSRTDDITVNSLCKAVGINHSTFYLHFNSIEDLSREIYRVMLDNLYDQYHKTGVEVKEMDHPAMMILLEHIRNNQNFYRMLIHSGTKDNFTNVFYFKWNEILKEHYTSNGLYSEQECEMRFICAQSAFAALINYWLSTNCTIDIDLVAKTAIECVIS